QMAGHQFVKCQAAHQRENNRTKKTFPSLLPADVWHHEMPPDHAAGQVRAHVREFRDRDQIQHVELSRELACARTRSEINNLGDEIVKPKHVQQTEQDLVTGEHDQQGDCPEANGADESQNERGTRGNQIGSSLFQCCRHLLHHLEGTRAVQDGTAAITRRMLATEELLSGHSGLALLWISSAMNESALQAIDRRPIATRNRKWAQSATAWLASRNVSPNVISIAGMGACIAAGIALSLTSVTYHRVFWLIAALGAQLRLTANLLDGMVALASGRA